MNDGLEIFLDEIAERLRREGQGHRGRIAATDLLLSQPRINDPARAISQNACLVERGSSAENVLKESPSPRCGQRGVVYA